MPKHSRDDPELKRDVGRRLLAYRETEGLGAKELCRDYSFGQTAWSMWETGKRLPNVYDMTELADDSGLSLDYIYRGRFEALPSELRRALRARLKLDEPERATVLNHPSSALAARTNPEHRQRRPLGRKK